MQLLLGRAQLSWGLLPDALAIDPDLLQLRPRIAHEIAQVSTQGLLLVRAEMEVADKHFGAGFGGQARHAALGPVRGEKTAEGCGRPLRAPTLLHPGRTQPS